MFNFSLKMESNNTKTIYDLPPEILIEILEKLPFDNNLYVVCKKFYNAYCFINQSTIILNLKKSILVM